MKGAIKYLNPSRGMVAILTEEGQFSVFELLSSDPVAVGDIVAWNPGTSLGSELLTNHTQGKQYEVYFQNHYVQLSQLRQQLLI